jgi:hypothetical protein
MPALGILLLLGAAAIAFGLGPWEPLGGVIFDLAPPALNTLQAGVQRRLAPWVWDELVLPVLEAPAWAVPAALGLLLLLLGLRRRRG